MKMSVKNHLADTKVKEAQHSVYPSLTCTCAKHLISLLYSFFLV